MKALEADMRKSCMYEYDFGDGWLHEIEIEEIILIEKKIHQPILLAGEKACPPENIGGIPGYEDFLTALANPKSEKHKEMLQWYGSSFDPECFEITEINKIFKSW